MKIMKAITILASLSLSGFVLAGQAGKVTFFNTSQYAMEVTYRACHSVDYKEETCDPTQQVNINGINTEGQNYTIVNGAVTPLPTPSSYSREYIKIIKINEIDREGNLIASTHLKSGDYLCSANFSISGKPFTFNALQLSDMQGSKIIACSSAVISSM